MSDLNIVCLDLEGVLVPEIWIAFAEASGIPELKIALKLPWQAAAAAGGGVMLFYLLVERPCV